MKLAALLLALLLAGCSVERGPTRWMSATVGEASYTPSATVAGIGPSMSGSGGIAITTSTVPSHYVVTFYLENGEKQSIDNVDWWRSCRIGQRVQLGYKCWRWKGREKWHWELESLRTYP